MIIEKETSIQLPRFLHQPTLILTLPARKTNLHYPFHRRRTNHQHPHRERARHRWADAPNRANHPNPLHHFLPIVDVGEGLVRHGHAEEIAEGWPSLLHAVDKQLLRRHVALHLLVPVDKLLHCPLAILHLPVKRAVPDHGIAHGVELSQGRHERAHPARHDLRHLVDRFVGALVPALGVAYGKQHLGLRVLRHQLAVERAARKVDRRLVATQQRLPIDRLAHGRLVPQAHVCGMLQRLRHVIAGIEAQRLQRNLQRLCARAAHARADKFHAGSILCLCVDVAAVGDSPRVYHRFR